MKLALLGGGGFRVPLVYGALLRDSHDARVDEVALYDTDELRLLAMGHTLRQLATGSDRPLPPPRIVTTGNLGEALEGADFVFSAIRVGGLAGRTCDERVALDLGVLGQETTGPGGLAYGLRTVPVAMAIANEVATRAPDAWFINFTNPAGMITQAMRAALGDRVVGICDSPIGLGRRAARALGVDPDRAELGYAGLNHLGWLRRLTVDGADILPELIGDADLLHTIEEGRLFGADWIQSIDALPNEYLYYYYFTRDAIAAIKGSAQTRGEFLLDQQNAFYAAVAADPDSALALWERTRAQREATYMAESRAADEGRDAPDLDGGGYEGVALAIMAAITRGEPAQLILNVPNGRTIAGLPPNAVVEVPCLVDGSGPHPLPSPGLEGHMLGLVQQLKAVEQLTISAAVEGSPRLAVEAFALHPLVESVTVARELLAGYRARITAVDAVFR